jgi:hypothetical protein
MQNLSEKLKKCLKSENINLEDVFTVGSELYLLGNSAMVEKAIARIKVLALSVTLSEKFDVDGSVSAVLALA